MLRNVGVCFGYILCECRYVEAELSKLGLFNFKKTQGMGSPNDMNEERWDEVCAE
jgi:hypothetical protein